MKKFIKSLFSTKTLLALTFLVNVAFFLLCVFFVQFYVAYSVAAVIALVLIILLANNPNENMPYKMTWMITILILPVFGVGMYLYLKGNPGTKREKKRYLEISAKTSAAFPENKETRVKFETEQAQFKKVGKYIMANTQMPVYQNTEIKYLSNGEEYFKELFAELRKARKFILIEYFIYAQGKIWNELFSILKEKARQGVEIKMLYDDYGCIDRFDDKKTFKKLANHKIEAVPFNKIKASLNLYMNYRDHRKIVVIDGITGFTGGINVGDEYANVKSPFGVWRDSGIKLTGDAVWNLTMIFLNSWQSSTKKALDVTKYKANTKAKTVAFVQPFGSGPLTANKVARDTYLQMINSAQNTLYVTTPYFIIDNELKETLKPDKRWVFYLARSYYGELIRAGVKIYEFTPGFLHAKMVVADGACGIIGTINFDFRSLYLHYEDGVAIYGKEALVDMNKDILDILSQSHLVTLTDVKKRRWYEKIIAQILKFFAPLL